MPLAYTHHLQLPITRSYISQSTVRISVERVVRKYLNSTTTRKDEVMIDRLLFLHFSVLREMVA